MAEPQRTHWLHRLGRHPVSLTTGWALLHTSKTLHRLCALGAGAIVIVSLLLIAAAWRLSQGPFSSPWLTNRVNETLRLAVAPEQVSFQSVALSWDGFRRGADYPLDLRLTGVEATDANGNKLLSAQDARMGFSLSDLLLGHFFPRSVEIDHAQIVVSQETAGLLGASDATAQNAPPFSVPSQLRRLRFRDMAVVIREQDLALVAVSQDADLEINRTRGDHFQGSLRAPLRLGGQAIELTASLDLAFGAESRLVAALTPFRPSGIGGGANLAFLRAVDVPIGLTATASLNPSLKPSHIEVSASLGQGELHIGQGTVPLLSGAVALSGSTERIEITQGHLDLLAAPDGKPETADVTGTVLRTADRLSASATIATGHLQAADLRTIWPPGVGGGSRGWIMEHVTGGTAHGSANFAIEADKDLHDIAVIKATGDLDVANGAFIWLDTVPPIEQAAAHLHLVDPDTLDISIAAAKQRVRPPHADLAITDGRMRITGLSVKDQDTTIRTGVSGPVGSVMAMLNEPRLHLLSTHPIGLKPTAGDVSAIVTFKFPLENKLKMDDVDIRTDVHLTKVKVPDIVAGRGLDDGAFDLTANKDGLSLKGQGALAGIPIGLTGMMDFRDGAAGQIVQQVTVTAQPDAAQLGAAGLGISDLLTGPVPLTAVVIERRGSDGSIAIGANLTAATLDFAPLAWHKPAGSAADASATVKLSHDRLVGVDGLHLRGDGLLITGSAVADDGGKPMVSLDTISLGRTQGHGTVRVAPDGRIDVTLAGASIDLGPKLSEPGGAAAAAVTAPPWSIDARFDEALLANHETARDLTVQARGRGDQVMTLDAGGATAERGRFLVEIGPAGHGRRLVVRAADAGRFLRGVDAIRDLSGGRLDLDGIFDGDAGLAPLSGTVTMTNVTVRDSPLLGKLLQAITLYGLVDALRGPGMEFALVTAPFRYDGRSIYLENAVASSSSLGLTASGRIGLGPAPSAMTGTIVPAYFFNALPGQLPLIGKLFSPEKGGGLFAARFGLDGPIADPNISVNPLSTLTPGFLRGLFGIFHERGQEPKPPP